jgi:hypothetical protein
LHGHAEDHRLVRLHDGLFLPLLLAVEVLGLGEPRGLVFAGLYWINCTGLHLLTPRHRLHAFAR